MGYAIGQITGVGGDAHKQLIGVIKTLAENNGWTTLRYDNTSPDHELILLGEGLTGTEEIYIGFKTYESLTADYYNILCAAFTGYVSGNPFENQPNGKYSGTFSHNNAIFYVLEANPQRIMGWQKVGTPVYSHFYLGKFLPYARPSEFPYPMICGGMLNGAEAIRYDNENKTFPYPGYYYSIAHNNLWLRDNSGSWVQPSSYPWTRGEEVAFNLAGVKSAAARQDTLAPIGANTDIYQLEPAIMFEARRDPNPKHIYGEFDGVYFCSGWNNGPENVVQLEGASVVDQTGLSMEDAVQAIHGVGGRALVMGQDNRRTDWRNYVALELMP